MTREEMKNWNKQATAGTVCDNMNPAFILNGVTDFLLSKIAKGEYDMKELAKRMLEDRHLDIDGKYVGFSCKIY